MLQKRRPNPSPQPQTHGKRNKTHDGRTTSEREAQPFAGRGRDVQRRPGVALTKLMAVDATSLFFLLFLFSLGSSTAAGVSQSDALLQLKKSLGNPATLSSWTSGTDPCSRSPPWKGVVCSNGIVNGLRLGGLGLSGTIDVDALRQVPTLRSLSFQDNALSGPFPDIGQIRGLKSVFFHHNHFSGPIPTNAFATMTTLKKIWLAGNQFSGPIPDSVASLPHLIELRLENNAFSGNLLAFDRQPSLKSLNVSNNQLTGSVPAELLMRFDSSCFIGNPNLNEGKALSAGSAGTTVPPPPSARKGTVTMVVVMLAMLCLVLCAAARHKEEADIPLHHMEHVHSMKSREVSPASSEKKPPLPTMAINGTELVFLRREGGRFVLMDLMRAAAEVLGSGELGSSYKAVIGDGNKTVVVKRMKEMNQHDKEGFHTRMCKLGKIRHQNVLAPVAYHYRREEKLLVFDCATKGNLIFLLHGDRGPHRPILEWQTRIKIAQGIARGLAHLHAELNDMDLPHGNLKSTNILFSDECEPLISDFGFSNLIKPSLANHNMVGFRSPEFVESQHVCHKSDVWCLGIVILEIITGKFPSQYVKNGKGGVDLLQWVRSELAEGHDMEIYDPEIIHQSSTVPCEMRQLLEIGVACTEPSLDRRLDMATAQQRIEAIKIEEEEEDQFVQSAAPSLIGGLSASQKNTLAVFSSRWSSSENLISFSNRHDENMTFEM